MNNFELNKRFVRDYSLPIQLINSDTFQYFLNLYETVFSSATLYNKTLNEINEKHNGDINSFLNYYYETREDIIKKISTSNAFKKLNEMDMQKYSISDKIEVSSKNVYNESNINKCYLSIDLKKANFQAINFVDKNILLNSDTYEDFIKKFTDSNYIINSKYFRSVIFGMMNPKRHITIEKYLINEVWKTYKEKFPYDSNICSLSNDEIVINTCMNVKDKVSFNSRCVDIKRFVREELGLEISVNYYFLEGYQLYSKKSGSPRNTFYTKTNLVSDNVELICVPTPYYALTYKLFNNIPLEELDYHFIYESIDCRFMEEFGIHKL